MKVMDPRFRRCRAHTVLRLSESTPLSGTVFHYRICCDLLTFTLSSAAFTAYDSAFTAYDPDEPLIYSDFNTARYVCQPFLSAVHYLLLRFFVFAFLFFVFPVSRLLLRLRRARTPRPGCALRRPSAAPSPLAGASAAFCAPAFSFSPMPYSAAAGSPSCRPLRFASVIRFARKNSLRRAAHSVSSTPPFTSGLWQKHPVISVTPPQAPPLPS